MRGAILSVNTGIKKRLAAFFEANPDEELTKSDIMVKFDATESAVEQALWILKAEGLLERASVYRASKEVRQRGARVL